MLRDLRGLFAFAHVVESGSFSAAAARLGITKSAVSKLVQGLEADLDVQLLVRTTRKLSLTEVGERVYASCARLAEDVESARQAAATQRAVVGHLRATAPAVLGREYLVPLAAEFLAAHPRVTLELDLSDEFVDLVGRRFDVAFRVGRNLTSSTLVARRIAEVRMIACAAPRYLARAGTPRTPGDLARHEWVLHNPRPDPDRVTFRRGKTSMSVRVKGRFACNDGAATVAGASAGHGIVLAPEYEVSDRIARGLLVVILEGWTLDGLTVSTVFPSQRHVPVKVRSFVDFVAERWETAPWSV